MSKYVVKKFKSWGIFSYSIVCLALVLGLTDLASAKLTPAYGVNEGLARQNAFIQSKISYDKTGPSYFHATRFPLDKKRDTQLPATFVDGVAISLEAYADYDAVAKLLKLEGLKPKREYVKVGKDPKTGAPVFSNKFAKVVLSFCRDNRVSYGSADTVRIAFQASLDEADFADPKDYKRLNRKNSDYVRTRVIWRYWADSPFEKTPLIRTVMGYPAVSGHVDLEVNKPDKSVILRDKTNGKTLLEAGFKSKIDHAHANFTNLASMVILPGSQTFAPAAKGLKRKNLVTWLDGFGTTMRKKQDFKPGVDYFKPQGKLARQLASIGFTTKYAKWSILNSYTGIFENRSVKLK